MTDKAEVQKDKNVSTRDEQSGTAADETVPEEMEARKRAVRLHQTCGPVDQCAHTYLSRGVPTDHEARSLVKRRQLQDTKSDADASLKRKTRSRRIHNREDVHVQERDKSHQHT